MSLINFVTVVQLTNEERVLVVKTTFVKTYLSEQLQELAIPLSLFHQIMKKDLHLNPFKL